MLALYVVLNMLTELNIAVVLNKYEKEQLGKISCQYEFLNHNNPTLNMRTFLFTISNVKLDEYRMCLNRSILTPATNITNLNTTR